MTDNNGCPAAPANSELYYNRRQTLYKDNQTLTRAATQNSTKQ